MDRILFYGGSWYSFSSFSSFIVRWRDTDWATSEHAYQAAKFDDPAIIAQIKNARSAYDAKIIAHTYEHMKIPHWHQVKLKIMEEIVRAKLAQHPYIRRKLLETGDREIIEDSPTDSFWGRGHDWRGDNHLGKIWMNLRQELKQCNSAD